MVVPQVLFVQFSVWQEVVLSSGSVGVLPIIPSRAEDFFRRYGKVHIEEGKGCSKEGMKSLVTFELAHQARAAQWDCDREPGLRPGELPHRVQFLGLVSWPGTNHG